ncbi:MAG: quinol:cytochrome C oxidoreductase [Chitinophagaceae bacterium]|nr:quinol:cytochrome C oxidoreductase [Chitinophagaceae bacterium]
MNDRFEIPARLRNTSLALIAVGVLALIGGIASLLTSHVDTERARFWSVLLHDSVFFTLITAVSIFIQAAVSLAQGAWIVAFRRVPEAIGANVWIFGSIATVVLFAIVFTFKDSHGVNTIFPWVTPAADDHIIHGKSAFLNKGMFVGFTLAAVGLWSYFGIKFRAMSIAQESAPKNDTKIYWKVFRMSGVFLLVYALTQMSTIPWLWVMSIDAHWFSTLFSWYTFASAFVSGMSLILLWVVYLKNQGNLGLVTTEHMHDLGKFMFAFSVFWTYLWFSQYMLIWYANVPEETVYFKMRQQGPYSIIFYANFIINFVMPILILMARPSKRNYFTVTFMAMVIIFGHWLDYYQMIMPGPLGGNWHINWYEIGIFMGFLGLLIFTVSRTLSKASLVPHNNILLKETAIHIA